MSVMHDDIPAPRRKATARSGASALVIDGEAVVLDRVALVKSAVQRAASAGLVHGSDDADADAAPHMPDMPAFGRRGARGDGEKRRPAGPDLFFQARSLERFARPARPEPGVASFLGDTAGSIPTGRKMAVLGVLVVSLLVPAALLVGRQTEVGAAQAGASQASPFVIEELTAGISPRGDGEILEVEGRVRNVSGEAAAVPPLRIALAGPEGGTTLRPVSTGDRTLAAGSTLRFHSAVAVPLGTDGDVSVDFVVTGGIGGRIDLADAPVPAAPPRTGKQIPE